MSPGGVGVHLQQTDLTRVSSEAPSSPWVPGKVLHVLKQSRGKKDVIGGGVRYERGRSSPQKLKMHKKGNKEAVLLVLRSSLA